MRSTNKNGIKLVIRYTVIMLYRLYTIDEVAMTDDCCNTDLQVEHDNSFLSQGQVFWKQFSVKTLSVPPFLPIFL